MYGALFILGQSIAGLPEGEKGMGDYAIVISTALTSFGCFWELYLSRVFSFKKWTLKKSYSQM